MTKQVGFHCVRLVLGEATWDKTSAFVTIEVQQNQVPTVRTKVRSPAFAIDFRNETDDIHERKRPKSSLFLETHGRDGAAQTFLGTVRGRMLV